VTRQPREGTVVTAIAERITGSREKTRQGFLVALAAYFVLQVLIRVVQGGSVEMDEAEQVFYAQHFHLGYDNQPPLYTWIQAAVFQLAGVNYFALALVKNVFMFVLYASVFQAARPLLGTLGACAVTASLLMVIPLSWEAQIDRTHSILATAVAAAALWAYYALLRHPARWRRALLGLLLALGMQSKYNFLVFIAGLAVASFMVREHRATIWTRDCWITAAVALLCLLPHAAWFFLQLDTATAETLRKMRDQGSPTSYSYNLLHGYKNFFVSIASFITPLWIPLAFSWRARKYPVPLSRPADARFFFWMYTAGLGCIAALVLTGGLVHVKSRWLQPLLFSFPLAFFVFFPPRSALVYRRILVTMAVFGVVLVAALAFRPQMQAAVGRHPRIYQPYEELASSIERRFPGVHGFVVQDRFVGGNIRLQFPDAPAVLMDDACSLKGRVLVLSGDGFDDGPRLPMPSCPGMTVVQHGQISERATLRPRERAAFDFALVDMAGP
jgi:4-amino-4-deoxy-L-arabinose transferase-like glycosyltransferase